MRVVIAKKLLSSVGGSEAQARALAAALRDRRHAVTLVGLRPAWRRPGIPDAVYGRARGIVELTEGGLAFRYVPARFDRAGAAIDGILPTALADGRLLAQALAGAEVVHCLAREWAGPLERAARAADAAFVETPLVHPGQRWSGAGAGDVARYRRDDAVIALTEWEAAWYRTRGVARVHVTGVGAILAPLPGIGAVLGPLPGVGAVLAALPDRPAEGATILFVGRKERYKGYDALRAAAPLVWRERPDARFVVIGQSRFLAPAPLADARWDERGIVSEAEKAEAYARCTLFCMPSSHETFGHTYLEAWLAGKPVVAGDIPPLREVVRDGIDGLHAANEPGAIARAILELLADPERARRMGASGRERAARWTWAKVAERTEAAYAAAVSFRRA